MGMPGSRLVPDQPTRADLIATGPIAEAIGTADCTGCSTCSIGAPARPGPEPSSAGVRLVRHLSMSSATGATASDGRPPPAGEGPEAKTINIDILLTCR